MKASEVLERYNAGERDFRRLNLRGQSFKGANLSGADFRECDIRGADFSSSILHEVRFCGAKAGLKRRWAIGLVIASWLMSAVAAFFSAFSGFFIASIIDASEIKSFDAALVCLIVLIVLFIFTLRRGLLAFARTFAFSSAGFSVFAATHVTGFTRAATVVRDLAFTFTLIFAFTFFGVLGLALSFAYAYAVAGNLALVGVALAGIILFLGAFPLSGFEFAFTYAVALVLINTYIGWRAMAEHKKDAWVRSIAITFAAIGGTSFRGADLYNADFTQAKLKSTDFRNAIVNRTCFRQTELLACLPFSVLSSLTKVNRN